MKEGSEVKEGGAVSGHFLPPAMEGRKGRKEGKERKGKEGKGRKEGKGMEGNGRKAGRKEAE